MRYLLFFIFLLIIIPDNRAQNCSITVEGDLPSCPGSLILLSVDESDTLRYLWTPGNDTTPAIIVNPVETTTYYVKVYNETYNCQDSVEIEVRPPINLTFNQYEKTCTGVDADCQGQVMAIAGDAFPPDEYSYIWEVQFIDPVDSSLALGLCGDVTYNIRITDKFGCSKDSAYHVEAFRSPVIEASFDPDSVVYIKNPWIRFSFVNLSADTLGITNYFWDFGDSVTSTLESPDHMFQRVDKYFVTLTVTDNNGCDTIFLYPCEVKPVMLLIPNVFTPNGDGINDELVFTAQEDKGDPQPINHYYKSNELVIFNRWGKKVYEAINYNNDWNGGNLADGVYFFILKCNGEFGQDVFKGSVTILGKNQ